MQVVSVAKPGKQDTVVSFLAGAQGMAEGEAFAPHGSRRRRVREHGDRSKHLGGEIAKALMANADALLAEPPVIGKVDALGAKL